MALHRYATAAVVAVTAATLTACSAATDGSAEPTSAAETTAVAADTSSAAVPAPAGVTGPGCASYAQAVPAGPGSLEGMAADPVAVALSNSPLLTTLAGALSGKLNADVDLTQTLNGGEFTVFAPTDDAFGKVDPATIEKLKADSALLTSVLTYHVVAGKPDPDALVGEHKTVQGAPLTVTASGDSLRVNGAGVLCGGIKTANATVYLIDTVLTPPPASPPAPPATTSTTATAIPTP